MKALFIAIILGAVGYYVFIYEPDVTPSIQPEQNQEISERQKILEEEGIENKSYQGALTDTYDSIKTTIQSAKDSVAKVEERSQAEY